MNFEDFKLTFVICLLLPIVILDIFINVYILKNDRWDNFFEDDPMGDPNLFYRS